MWSRSMFPLQRRSSSAVSRPPSLRSRLSVNASGEVLVGGDTVETLAGLRDTFDALFMGSRGYGPIGRVLLGGVSARLMRRLDVRLSSCLAADSAHRSPGITGKVEGMKA